MRWWVLPIALLSGLLLAPTGDDPYGAASWQRLKTLVDCDNGTTAKLLYDTTTRTFSCGTDQAGGGVSDGDKGDITVSGTGATWTVDSGAVDFSELGGSATDAQIPNNITIDLATIATTANTGDSATAFFASGAVEAARLDASMATDAEVAAGYQPLDADLTDLADGTLTGSKVQTFGSANAGAVDASGGGTTNFLRADGTWAAPGGGGSPGTPTSSVQYNNASAFGGAANVNIDANGDLNIDERASTAATPTASMTLFVREKAGKRFLNMIGPSGLDTPVQPGLFANSVAMWLPNTGATPEEFGMDAAVTATVSHPAIATTNLWQSMKRFRMATTTTAGNSSGVRSNADIVWRGNAAGLGGWFFSARCTSPVTVAQGRAFVGVKDATAVHANANPSAQLDVAYFGFDSAQTTWRFCTNDNAGAATCTDLGANFPVNLSSDGFEFRMFAAPNASSIGWYAERLGTGATASGTASTDLPRNSVMLAVELWNNNGTTAAANQLECNRVYVESDY